MKKLFVGKSGFCWGVERALRVLLSLLESEEEVFLRGELLHNRVVSGELSKMGVRYYSSPEEVVPGAVVVLRTHGEEKKIVEELEQRGARLVDLACPIVRKVLETARSSASPVYLVGKRKDHPEVRYVLSHSGATFLLAGEYGGSGSYVFQTTVSKETVNFYRGIPGVVVKDTTCPEIGEREKCVEELSKKVEGILILGDSHSSNTNTLLKGALKCGVDAERVLLPEEVPEKFFEMERVGLVSGASVGADAVDAVVEVFLRRGFEVERSP